MNGLFFTSDPLSGRKKPTRLLLATLAVLFFVVVIWLFALKAARSGQIASAPSPQTPTLAFTPTTPPTPTPSPSPTYTQVATQTATATKDPRKELVEQIAECPPPDQWRLEALPNTQKVWHRIVRPACALDGLARAIAWYMLTYAGGYTFEEAARSLAFGERFPILYPARGTRFPFKTPKGVWQAANTNIPYVPGLRMWMTDENDTPRLPVFTPAGCYYARHLQRGEWRDWKDWYGAPFELQCVVYADEWRYRYVVQSGERTVAFDIEHFQDADLSPLIRHTYVFAYDSERGWYLLGGYITDQRFSYTPEELGVTTWPLVADHQRVVREWGRNVVWDEAWLQATWGLEPRPLPTYTEVLTTKAEWSQFWKPILTYFYQKWPEHDQYFWAFKNPPDR